MTVFVCPTGTSIVAGPPLGTGESEEDFRSRIDKRVLDVWNARANDESFLVRVSAETNGLVRMGCGADDTVYLLASDTPAGKICAEKLAAQIEAKIGAAAIVRTIAGLRVTDGEAFRKEGIRSLFGALDAIRVEHAGETIRINATGGFKGTLPFVVIYAMNHGFECAYVFDQSDTLISLPRLPLAIDLGGMADLAPIIAWLEEEIAVDPAEWQRHLVDTSYWERQDEFDILFEHFDGQVMLSPVGLLVSSAIIARRQRTKVFLSASAVATLDSASDEHRGYYLDILTRVRDPVRRQNYRHHEYIRPNSDQVVWKSGTHSSQYVRRMTYWIEDGHIFVGELFPDHAEYEHFYKNVRKNIADYDRGEFVEHISAQNATSYGDLLNEIKADKDAWRAEREQLEVTREELERERGEIDRTIRNSVAAELERKDRAIQALRQQHEAEIQKLRTRHGQKLGKQRRRIEALEAEIDILKAENHASGEPAEGGKGD